VAPLFPGMIRVLVAEDHPVVRDGLVRLLGGAPDIAVVADAADGDEAVRLAAEHQPDVVLMDLRMPTMDGSVATSLVLRDSPRIRVVILTSFAEREEILHALDAGAVGYMLKDADPAELIRGVRVAANGDSPLAPKVARTLLDHRAMHVSRELTERETEVLRCVARGLPNKLIARELEISESTVKAHLTSTFQRIGVTDRVQAALWAREQGIASPEPAGRA
jgi:DNA-binding NarL/FixJ family response regulator